jgi:hypothetical protein
LVLDYKSAFAKYFPWQAPDYVSLEGYVDANDMFYFRAAVASRTLAAASQTHIFCQELSASRKERHLLDFPKSISERFPPTDETFLDAPGPRIRYALIEFRENDS